jgi:hypothetical protein
MSAFLGAVDNWIGVFFIVRRGHGCVLMKRLNIWSVLGLYMVVPDYPAKEEREIRTVYGTRLTMV